MSQLFLSIPQSIFTAKVLYLASLSILWSAFSLSFEDRLITVVTVGTVVTVFFFTVIINNLFKHSKKKKTKQNKTKQNKKKLVYCFNFFFVTDLIVLYVAQCLFVRFFQPMTSFHVTTRHFTIPLHFCRGIAIFFSANHKPPCHFTIPVYKVVEGSYWVNCLDITAF